MRCIRTDYVKDFRCDGKICGSRCCRDWHVPIDEETLEKYSALEEKEKFFQNFERIDGENSLAIKMSPQGLCAFLDEDFLCKIQKRHGENFLTAICQSYPRVTYKLSEKIFEQSMTLTCPVAAEQILLREEPITFEETEKISARLVIDFSEKLSRSAEEILNFQAGAIKILQDRNFSINRRLRKLYEFFGGEILADFDEENHAIALAEIFSETYGANLDMQGKKILCGNYRGSRKKILRQIEENFSHVSENYLVNEFFMRCMPCAFPGDELTNCKIFIASFRLLEFALVLTVIAQKNLTAGDLINLICSVNDKLDHSKGGMSAIINFAGSCGEEDFSALILEDD